MAIEINLFDAFFRWVIIREKFNYVIFGEDKHLHNYIAEQGLRIAFSREAKVYDKKSAQHQQLNNQRIRWFNTYFENMKYAANTIKKGLLRREWHVFLLGIMTLYPHLIFLMSGSILLLFLNSMFVNILPAILMLSSMLIFFINFIIVLKIQHLDNKVFAALSGIPRFILSQIFALFHLDRTKNDFLTTHKSMVIGLEELKTQNNSLVVV